jgi:hypothetical protein
MWRFAPKLPPFSHVFATPPDHPAVILLLPLGPETRRQSSQGPRNCAHFVLRSTPEGKFARIDWTAF